MSNSGLKSHDGETRAGTPKKDSGNQEEDNETESLSTLKLTTSGGIRCRCRSAAPACTRLETPEEGRRIDVRGAGRAAELRRPPRDDVRADPSVRAVLQRADQGQSGQPSSPTDFVCDLCTEMPKPADGGKTYTFNIRRA